MRFFATNGEVEIGARELARALKINAGNIQRELTRLAELGLLVREEGTAPTYSPSKKLVDLARKIEL
jgi:DNA-binding IclR family transcriptional regulator